jgi:hypothetical protein
VLTEMTVEPRAWKPERKLHQVPPIAPIEREGDLYLRRPDGSLAVMLLDLPPGLAERMPLLSQMVRLKLDWGASLVAGTSRSSSGEIRLSGIRYAARVFGWNEPKPLRRRYGATRAQIHGELPELSDALDRTAVDLWHLFEERAPAEAADHEARVLDRIRPDWLMGSAPWTSGIINKTAALPYHRDAGNVRQSWSVQITTRRGVGGGDLHFPEFDICLPVGDASVMYFVGSNVWHGVTPIEMNQANGFRYSIVFYAKNGLGLCDSAADEAARAARRATELTEAARK